MLRCYSCKEIKEKKYFNRQATKRGYQYHCRRCAAKKRMQNKGIFLKLQPDRLSKYYGFWKFVEDKWMLWACCESDPLTNHLFKKQGYLITQVSEKFYCQVNQLINSNSHQSRIAKKMGKRLYPTETGQHLRKHYEGYEH